MAACFLICQSQSPSAGDNRDEAYYRQRDELIAQEKDLLTEESNTSKRVFELKRTINELYKQLSATQDYYENIRHKLISIHMKLMD